MSYQEAQEMHDRASDDCCDLLAKENIKPNKRLWDSLFNASNAVDDYKGQFGLENIIDNEELLEEHLKAFIKCFF